MEQGLRVGGVLRSGGRLLAVALTGLLTAPAPGAQQCELYRVTGDTGAALGRSVAIAGTTAVVGAHLDTVNGVQSGSASVLDTTTGQETALLVPSDGLEDEFFGRAVALGGTLAVVGAPFDDPNGLDSGSAYLFDVGTGQQLAKLVATDGESHDFFGHSVGISGRTILVGAYGDDDNGSLAGAAYLFDATTGQQVAKLLAADGAPSDRFGQSVAISGTTAIVGAPGDDDNRGSAYVFDTVTGQQVGKLLASDGVPNVTFGSAVAIHGTTVLVGADREDTNGENAGAAYLFDASTRQQVAKLLPASIQFSQFFGSSVALDGSTAIVGMAASSTFYRPDSAHLFDAATGQHLAELTEPYGGVDILFGAAVAIDGPTALLGAPSDVSFDGAVYVFDDAGCNPGTASCFGVGCPCGNDDPTAGCANSTGSGGLLTATGSTRVSLDSLVLRARQLPPESNGLFYMGDSQVQGPFYDGLQCALGTTFRFLESIQQSGAYGTMTLGPGIVGRSGGLVTPGSTWHFHAWHRDVPGTPCGTGANLTNLYSVTFVP